MRPVHAGLCRYESLRDGSLTLEDILIMNVYLDNYGYNSEQVMKAQQNGNRS